jgi:hypothetical protein
MKAEPSCSALCDRLRTLRLKCVQASVAAVGELCNDMHGRGLWEANDADLLEAVWQFRRSFDASTANIGRKEA